MWAGDGPPQRVPSWAQYQASNSAWLIRVSFTRWPTTAAAPISTPMSKKPIPTSRERLRQVTRKPYQATVPWNTTERVVVDPNAKASSTVDGSCGTADDGLSLDWLLGPTPLTLGGPGLGRLLNALSNSGHLGSPKPNYKLILNRGDGSEPTVVEDYESVVPLPPDVPFNYDGEMWKVETVDGCTLRCKPADAIG
jgi:hypothetical protein